MRGIVALALVLLATAASARWKPEYAQRSPEERAWYERQQTTPETRARLKANWYMFCCDHSDTVEAEIGKKDGHWYYRTAGESEWHSIPDDIVQDTVMTPHGKPVLFVDATGHNFGPVCFFPGGAGA